MGKRTSILNYYYFVFVEVVLFCCPYSIQILQIIMCIVIFTHGKFKYILMTDVNRTK